MSRILDGMKAAREALSEYYRDDAPVMVLIDDAIVAAESLEKEFRCIGVIDSEGDIYPEPPESGTQIFVKTKDAAQKGE